MKMPMRLLGMTAVCLFVCLSIACEKQQAQSEKKTSAKKPAAKVALGKSPHVVLINISGLRYDRVGKGSEIVPFLNQFAGKSVVFQNAYASESYTLASVASLFTGLYPHSHQALYVKPKIQGLHKDEPTLASELSQMGYNCSAIVSGTQVLPLFGLNNGFKRYLVIRENAGASAPAWKFSNTSEGIYNTLKKTLAEPQRPQFLYLHFSDTQMPSLPPPPYHVKHASEDTRPFVETAYAQKALPKFDLKNRDIPEALYNGAASYVDHWVGQSLQYLEEIGIGPKESIIIITSDHGQELFDRHSKYLPGMSAGRSLYNEQIHVPLMMSLPGTQAKTINHPVELVDIAPTVLQLLKAKWDKRIIDGQSLMPTINKNTRIKRVAYSGGNHDRGAIVNGIWKYVESDRSLRKQAAVLNSDNPEKPEVIEELYNLKTDPFERNNNAAKRPEIVKTMKEHLRARRDGEELPTLKKPAVKQASAKADPE